MTHVGICHHLELSDTSLPLGHREISCIILRFLSGDGGVCPVLELGRYSQNFIHPII